MLLPNQLTVARIILTPFFMFFFLHGNQTFREISLVIFLIAALTDWYDGWLARKFNYFTSWGKFWDPMADKILTAGAFFGLVFIGVLPAWMVILIIIRDFAVTLFRGYADHKGLSFPTSRYAKWKTFIQMAYLYYILIMVTASRSSFLSSDILYFINQYLLNGTANYYALLTVTIITIHSGILYFLENKNVIKKASSHEQV
ncbi:MAG: CDP-diacylglycerol--glycerol-3-phosphate 3-phosphatidyltransferase [Ignavibacteria bacterium]|nr:CDP-diacylglycerol--glycerol-3-phosphate 3-phosphatidyltransferase [Ignavibacteria bacterium]